MGEREYRIEYFGGGRKLLRLKYCINSSDD
ncbi:MAG: hypothetical protein ACI9DF_004798 [Verrucomicrobiales bacterium]|jgi:hypothetical protein